MTKSNTWPFSFAPVLERGKVIEDIIGAVGNIEIWIGRLVQTNAQMLNLLRLITVVTKQTIPTIR